MVDFTLLRARFRGEMLTAADGARFDAARSAFNAAFDRRPGVIARATGADDVIAAVNFARKARMPLAVRGGGHSVAGYSTIEGACCWTSMSARQLMRQCGDLRCITATRWRCMTHVHRSSTDRQRAVSPVIAVRAALSS